MLMLIELCLKELLSFLYSNINSDPSLVLRVNDSTSMDAEVSEPLFDVGNGLFLWSKHIVNLLRGPVLAKFLRLGIGASGGQSVAQTINWVHWYGFLHFHKVVITLLQISLRQANSHWNHSIFLNASTFDPVARWRGSLLVENMLDGSWSSIDESRDGNHNGNLDKHFGA